LERGNGNRRVRRLNRDSLQRANQLWTLRLPGTRFGWRAALPRSEVDLGGSLWQKLCRLQRVRLLETGRQTRVVDRIFFGQSFSPGNWNYRQPGLLCTPRNFENS
jgi:hypothetical protein